MAFFNAGLCLPFLPSVCASTRILLWFSMFSMLVDRVCLSALMARILGSFGAVLGVVKLLVSTFRRESVD